MELLTMYVAVLSVVLLVIFSWPVRQLADAKDWRLLKGAMLFVMYAYSGVVLFLLVQIFIKHTEPTLPHFLLLSSAIAIFVHVVDICVYGIEKQRAAQV